jgi:hypothetical protein
MAAYGFLAKLYFVRTQLGKGGDRPGLLWESAGRSRVDRSGEAAWEVHDTFPSLPAVLCSDGIREEVGYVAPLQGRRVKKALAFVPLGGLPVMKSPGGSNDARYPITAYSCYSHSVILTAPHGWSPRSLPPMSYVIATDLPNLKGVDAVKYR